MLKISESVLFFLWKKIRSNSEKSGQLKIELSTEKDKEIIDFLNKNDQLSKLLTNVQSKYVDLIKPGNIEKAALSLKVSNAHIPEEAREHKNLTEALEFIAGKISFNEKIIFEIKKDQLKAVFNSFLSSFKKDELKIENKEVKSYESQKEQLLKLIKEGLVDGYPENRLEFKCKLNEDTYPGLALMVTLFSFENSGYLTIHEIVPNRTQFDINLGLNKKIQPLLENTHLGNKGMMIKAGETLKVFGKDHIIKLPPKDELIVLDERIYLDKPLKRKKEHYFYIQPHDSDSFVAVKVPRGVLFIIEQLFPLRKKGEEERGMTANEMAEKKVYTEGSLHTYRGEIASIQKNTEFGIKEIITTTGARNIWSLNPKLDCCK